MQSPYAGMYVFRRRGDPKTWEFRSIEVSPQALTIHYLDIASIPPPPSPLPLCPL